MKPGDLVGVDFMDEFGKLVRRICIILKLRVHDRHLHSEEQRFRFTLLTDTGEVIKVVRARLHTLYSSYEDR